MDALVTETRCLAADPVEIDPTDLRAALLGAWGEDRGTLLAHAYDGVIWGLVAAGGLLLAGDGGERKGARLRAETLTDLRLFDAERELRLWRRTDGGLAACLVHEAAAGRDFAAYQERKYLLLGRADPAAATGDRFVRRRGRSGSEHWAPEGAGCLCVRHYFEQDPGSALLRLAEHRMTGLAA